MQNRLMTRVLTVLLQIAAAGCFGEVWAAELSGTVRDAKTLEPIEGATVLIKDANRGANTDANGRYLIRNIDEGDYILVVSALAYRTVEIECRVRAATVVDITLASEDVEMDEVIVRARARNNTENALVQIVKTLPQVTSGISAAQISKTSDRTASEVVRRASGVTVIDDRFVVVRGLAQRYNNAWINGMSAPSAETDSRAFPFDLVPSSQIDNLVVYKSPSPDIPGDFSGGFVKITSKGVPDANSMDASYATGFNAKTQFDDFRAGAGSATDFLGFDNGRRQLSNDFPKHLANANPDEITRLTKNGFNRDWTVRNFRPLPDQRFTFTVARRMETKGDRVVGNLTSLNYSNTFKSLWRMKNARYNTYNYKDDRPVYLDDYMDNQFSNDARLGVLHNWTLVVNPSNRIEFKNLLNVLGRNRLTERTGVKDVSSMYYREQTEIQYSSRTIYCGQFSGLHDLSSASGLTWDAGYSYAGKKEPDRRIVNNYAGVGSKEDIPFVETQNDNISRYFRELHDNAVSAALNYRHTFDRLFSATLKTGFYGEYQSRDYSVREFVYRYSNLTNDEQQTYLSLPFAEMLDDKYLGADKVFIDEITQKTNNYSADVLHVAGYAAFEIPVNRLSIYAGVRLENRNTTLTRDRSMNPSLTLISEKSIAELNVLPSINAVFKFSERHQLRAAYGRSVNRPELRELSPSVYYDFDLFSEISGNEDLQTATIDNFDLRYEFYPAFGETVSLGVFFKYFRNPIEWTFVDMGGSLRYGYENAREAVSRGVELDVRKSLDFVGLPDLSVVANVALIASDVRFAPGEVVSEPDRAMQGQSPYLVNVGLYYSSAKAGLTVSALYNRIGKRIVGLGKSNVPDQNVNNMVPDSYEMPRNSLDLSIVKKVGKRTEIRFSIRDILSEDVVFVQFPKFKLDGVTYQRQQTTKQFNQGQFFAIGAGIKF
jgi:outer membrane receptor protein involved in Fe transport